MRPVKDTSELRRIMALPRRDSTGGQDLAELTQRLTQALKTEHGTMSLRTIQAFALAELYGEGPQEHGGLFGPIGVGQGKALIALLAPVVRQKFKPILFLPAPLKVQTEEQVIPEMRKHWRLHKNLRIESYNFLSSPKSTDFLEEYKPDMIILDEAHALKRSDASRTKRFLRYMKSHPGCELVALSGTMTQKSLFDFWELCKLALPGLKCPLPLHYSILKEWDAAIGADSSWSQDEPMEPGALEMLCDKGENVRQGFRRRLVETPGVVATSASAIGTSLIISKQNIQVPAQIATALAELRRTERTVWGEEVEDGVALSRHAKQLACGFYYRWRWPNDQPDVEWLFARSAWHRELRYHLKRNMSGLDSPFLVAGAIARGDLESEAYAPWVAIRGRHHPHPPVETVWIDTYMIDHALKWMSDHPTGIVWYEHTAIGERLRKAGAQVFGAGPDAARAIISAKGPLAASILAHGTGKNLQAWDSNLVLSCPSSGATWQQLIARTHRPGQMADEVTCDILLHTQELREAWIKALSIAEYLEHSTGDSQKLLLATKVGFNSAAERTAA